MGAATNRHPGANHPENATSRLGVCPWSTEMWRSRHNLCHRVGHWNQVNFFALFRTQTWMTIMSSNLLAFTDSAFLPIFSPWFIAKLSAWRTHWPFLVISMWKATFWRIIVPQRGRSVIQFLLTLWPVMLPRKMKFEGRRVLIIFLNDFIAIVINYAQLIGFCDCKPLWFHNSSFHSIDATTCWQPRKSGNDCHLFSSKYDTHHCSVSS